MSDVFISYSHKDSGRRNAIYELLKNAGLDVWVDVKGIRHGDQLNERIVPAIEGTKCVLFIHSKESAKSRWVQEEIAYADKIGRPIVIVSFGSIPFGEKFPAYMETSKRIVVEGNFSPRKKKELQQWVERVVHQKRAPVITMLNLKGGVGKTALAANLFGCLHERAAKSVLLIDLDPQHNLTQLLLDEGLMAQKLSSGETIMATFRGFGTNTDAADEKVDPISAEAVLERCRLALKRNDKGETRFDLVPGSFETIVYFLSKRHQHFDQNDVVWTNFIKFIEHVRTQYDIVVIDVNPGASLMTELAVFVSNFVLSPVRPDRFSKYGLKLLDSLLSKVRLDRARKLQQIVIMNSVGSQETDSIAESISNENRLAEMMPRIVMQSRIPYSRRLEARPAKAAVNDLTMNLAYHRRIGNNAAADAIERASDELTKVMKL